VREFEEKKYVRGCVILTVNSKEENSGFRPKFGLRIKDNWKENYKIYKITIF
jgi:hypothetical protein